MRKFLIGVAIAAMSTSAAVATQAEAASAQAEFVVDFETQKETTASRTHSVSTQGSARDSRDDVYDKALFMAAKKTMRENYDWFRVVDSKTDGETKYEVTLDFDMGKGPVVNGGRVYDARNIRDTQ